MSNRLLKVTTTLLITIGLSNCARQEALVMPQFPQQVNAVSDLRSNYVVLDKTTMHKDNNGDQFGFDYYSAQYSYFGKNSITLSHSKLSGIYMLTLTRHIGTPEQKGKDISDKNGINQTISDLNELMITAGSKDKATLREMITVLKNIKPRDLTAQSIKKVTLKKAQVLKQLSKNTISFSRDEVPGEIIIDFSNGRINSPYPGRLTMYLKESGISSIYVTHTFGAYNHVALTKEETIKLLKGALNYSEHAAKLNKILG